MRRGAAVAAVLLFAILAAGRAPVPAGVLSAEVQDDMVIVRIDGATFTCYRFGPGQKYPYFYPVNGPRTGLPLTTESSLPYPHHRSLWFGCDRVNGGDYWQEGNERGQIVSRGPKIAVSGPERVRIEDACDWRQPGQSPVLSDTRRITVSAPSPGLRFIDFEIELTALIDVKIEKTNHSLFAARIDPALAVPRGGVLRNAEDLRGEKATFGQASPWMDFSGSRCGTVEGLALFDGPENPWHPSRWFTRDYGFFSPTPLNWLDEGGWTIPKGKTAAFRYRVVVHEGDADRAGIAGLYSKWAAGAAAAK